jgi:glycosyltransferase involved in cell wall biosynthesis
MTRRGPVVCLLPVRNARADVPAWLESTARVADAVVALDDGSTDDTAELLEASPLVSLLLRNPRRRSYRGWDDSANRNRLLEAAAELDPGWILSLDADERMPADDARALREFLERDALTGCAYGFRHFRMWGDRRYDPRFTWIYRLFAHRPGPSFPDDTRLHFNPIPEGIPYGAWVRTSLRIQHFGAASKARLAARAVKYREADPESIPRSDHGGLSTRPGRRLPRWSPRPADLAVLAPDSPPPTRSEVAIARFHAESAARNGRPVARPRLVCLLPARNCETELPGWLESVRAFADGIVALDDGSTDGTRERLAGDPLVKTLLENPPRPTYAGWDDAANRNRLLSAAAELDPDWILSLDADERLDPEDAAALHTFIEQEALPGFAYGFRVFRMVHDLTHFDQDSLLVYRLFAYERGQSLPDRRLHFVPVPTTIERDRWVDTTLRIQHLAGLTDSQRRARFDKYRQADPHNRFQRDYSNLLRPPGELTPWAPRPSDQLVVEDPSSALPDPEQELEELDLGGPVLSAIVIAQNDEERIERVVCAVVDQECPEPFEVIVVTSGSDRTGQIVRESFPEVRLVELPRPALPGEARNAGLALASGDYVSFPGSHVELPQGSLAARIRAHEQGHAMVTGSTLNGTDNWPGWASYFLDHSTVLPGRPSEPLEGPPAHCSYMRHLLEQVGGFPEGLRAGEDTVVNRELWRRGHGAQRVADVRLVHRSRCTTPIRLVRHHFVRGRAMGRMMLDDYGEGAAMNRRLVWGVGVMYLPRRISRINTNVKRWGGKLRGAYLRSLPLIAAGAAAAWTGCWWELLRPGRSRRRAAAGDRSG